jgi:hypothetical protein
VKDDVRKRLKAADELDSHTYICDLVYVEFPVLSLYSDSRNNWLYLWHDTNKSGVDQWLLFKASRDDLSDYLRKKKSLRSIIDSATRLLLLEMRAGEFEQKSHARAPARPRRNLWQVNSDEFAAALPAKDSYFDSSLTEDLDLSKDVLPRDYAVPIDGTWFERDFEFLFKRYRRLYSFFYATRPQFVRTVAHKLFQALRAPWRGGYSRLNLYTRLSEDIPAQHTLRVAELEFASPGHVSFEALPGIGESIAKSLLLYLENEEAISHASNTIARELKRTGLATRDVSELSDEQLGVYAATFAELHQCCNTIATALHVSNEVHTLRQASPNTATYSKAVNSFVRQVSMLASLQRQEMLDLTRVSRPHSKRKKKTRAKRTI